ncbi:hypothetical protein V6N11_016004 [Hibiscus sabdariffa]|uniref:Integrase catalytic domain-containing protein n=1 Tax=Hibiscus sabdariffa TaxID=183260 RepID=A0ABR2TUK9_9ROSI
MSFFVFKGRSILALLVTYEHNSYTSCMTLLKGDIQRIKAEKIPYPGLLQPLPIPTQAWQCITMDFIEGLPCSMKYNCILMIIDKFTKYVHFISLAHPFTVLEVAKQYLDQVYKLHGPPQIAISDRDRTFTSLFWKELFKQLGTSTLFSTAHHSQTDGQTEKLNQCLEQYLRGLCFQKPRDWAKWLPHAEFWYNTNYHTALKLTPFEALYGYKPTIPSAPTDSSSSECPATITTSKPA